MRTCYIVAAILAISLHIGAQERPPDTIAPANSEAGSSISKPNTNQKADGGRQTGDAESQVVPCNQISPCYVVQEPQTQTKEQQAREASLETLTRRYMWATIIGVIGAWIGLGILIRQTIMMWQTSERELRAYVLSDSSVIFNVANPVPLYPEQVLPQTDARITNTAAGPGAFVQIKNTGQTPAFKVMHWGYICFREYPLVAALPARLPIVANPPTSVLGPAQTTTKMLELNSPLTAAQINDLRNGTGAIYVYGEVIYVDAFGKNRFTRYRAMYHRVGRAIGVSTSLNFCEEGNDAN